MSVWSYRPSETVTRPQTCFKNKDFGTQQSDNFPNQQVSQDQDSDDDGSIDHGDTSDTSDTDDTIYVDAVGTLSNSAPELRLSVAEVRAIPGPSRRGGRKTSSACQACHSANQKCLSSDGQASCQRCKRQGLLCEKREAKKPRRNETPRSFNQVSILPEDLQTLLSQWRQKHGSELPPCAANIPASNLIFHLKTYEPAHWIYRDGTPLNARMCELPSYFIRRKPGFWQLAVVEGSAISPFIIFYYQSGAQVGNLSVGRGGTAYKIWVGDVAGDQRGFELTPSVLKYYGTTIPGTKPDRPTSNTLKRGVLKANLEDDWRPPRKSEPILRDPDDGYRCRLKRRRTDLYSDRSDVPEAEPAYPLDNNSLGRKNSLAPTAADSRFKTEDRRQVGTTSPEEKSAPGEADASPPTSSHYGRALKQTSHSFQGDIELQPLTQEDNNPETAVHSTSNSRRKRNTCTIDVCGEANPTSACNDTGYTQMEPLLFAPYVYHFDLQLVICTICMHGISDAKHLHLHVHEKHSSIFNALDEKEQSQVIEQFEGLQITSQEERQPMEPYMYHFKDLPLLETGFKCKDCNLPGDSAKTIADHVASHGGGSYQEMVVADQWVQRLYLTGTTRHCFLVKRPDLSEDLTSARPAICSDVRNYSQRKSTKILAGRETNQHGATDSDNPTRGKTPANDLKHLDARAVLNPGLSVRERKKIEAEELLFRRLEEELAEEQNGTKKFTSNEIDIDTPSAPRRSGRGLERSAASHGARSKRMSGYDRAETDDFQSLSPSDDMDEDLLASFQAPLSPTSNRPTSARPQTGRPASIGRSVAQSQPRSPASTLPISKRRTVPWLEPPSPRRIQAPVQAPNPTYVQPTSAEPPVHPPDPTPSLSRLAQLQPSPTIAQSTIATLTPAVSASAPTGDIYTRTKIIFHAFNTDITRTKPLSKCNSIAKLFAQALTGDVFSRPSPRVVLASIEPENGITQTQISLAEDDEDDFEDFLEAVKVASDTVGKKCVVHFRERH